MTEHPVLELTMSMSRLAVASTLFVSRAAANLMRSGDLAEPMHQTAAVLGKAAEAMVRRPGGCNCRQEAPQQTLGSGWGPVPQDE